ncbi:LapA family protein [Aphanothece sacrum]|uniref:Lipopolysaccharide assembly protein A domain-containing protein n=1 Tax=Aphanothece sacrum FPU1 TaxID=1920663 RepID=A0A401IHT3_APHSA|nr:LapA family protein [Aphanothece sacrum]GBF80852.1 hypothetical protein AsFPU1_2259 [Aphanothece sacrum FPU1]GBF85638.1 hypothetical protein AsFPU3_2702 [Aphanothece sacrum FPU3]
MKLLLLLLILASAVILLVQNQQVIVLYVLGTSSKTALFSLKLPLGFWVLLGSLAGMFTSLIIQSLTRSPQSAKTKSPKSPRRKPPQPSAKKPSPPPPPKKSDWEVPNLRDWEKPEPEEDDWNIEEPPTEPTISYRSAKPPVEPFAPEREAVKFEVEQSPKSSSREGSVYSYTYRELRDRKETPETSPESRGIEARKGQTPEQVYDANYRVITPPYRNPQDSVTDEEEGDQEEWV